MLGLGDELRVEHLVQDDVADRDRLCGRGHDEARLAVDLLRHGLRRRIQARGRAHQPGQEGRLTDRQLLVGFVGGDVLLEVGPGGGPDPVGVIAVVDLVEVHLDDALLALRARVAVVEAQRQDRLLDLALDLAVCIGHQVRAEQPHPDELLADGRRAGDGLAGLEILEDGPHDAAQVHARIGPERLVLRGYLRLDHDLRHLVVADLAPILHGEGGKLRSVARQDGGAFHEVEVLDAGHVRQPARVRAVHVQDQGEQADRQHTEHRQDDSGERGGAGPAARIGASGATTRRGPPGGRRWTSGHRAAG